MECNISCRVSEEQDIVVNSSLKVQLVQFKIAPLPLTMYLSFMAVSSILLRQWWLYYVSLPLFLSAFSSNLLKSLKWNLCCRMILLSVVVVRHDIGLHLLPAGFFCPSWLQKEVRYGFKVLDILLCLRCYCIFSGLGQALSICTHFLLDFLKKWCLYLVQLFLHMPNWGL